MFRNYFVIAVRNLLRNRMISAINLSGLALGMAGTMLLLMNIAFEFSFDDFHVNKERIFRVYNRAVVDGNLSAWNATPAPLGPVLKKDYPFIEHFCRHFGTEKVFHVNDKKLRSTGSIADPGFLKMFSFPLVSGNENSALADFHSIVITEDLARRLFNSIDVVGRIVTIDNEDRFTISGVLRDLPPNTEFRFDFILPWSYLASKNMESKAWDNNFLATYVQLKEDIDGAEASRQIGNITKSYSNTEQVELFLHPFTREHLYNRFVNGQEAGGRIQNLYFMFVLAVMILLIACINFMNLATARSEKRAREVGVRKVMGAVKRNLVTQFIAESVLMALFAAIIAYVVILLVLPSYNAFANAELRLPYESVYFWISATAFILLTGILAGSYPAFFLSAFKPVHVFRGVLKNGSALVLPRKILVVVQFVLAVFLINFMILFRKQVNFIEKRDPGFEQENLVFHHMTADLDRNYEVLRSELLLSKDAVAISRTNTPVMWSAGSVTGFEWDGHDASENSSFEYLTTDGDFIRTNGLKLLAGRELDLYKFPRDTAACMINETALKVMGLDQPVGKAIRSGSSRKIIVGVVQDFLTTAPNQAIRPVYIEARHDGQFISIRLKPGGERIARVQETIKRHNPGFITELSFADVEHDRKFRQARNASSLINTFAGVAIFISCLGLFGLSVYMTENRTREIGIRKVLGASVRGVTILLTQQFVKLVFVAILIGTPVAWLFMNFFLDSFEYRTSLTAWIPLISAATAIFIAVITVSIQSVKAAVANPVKSLRTE
jgi:putative ABC transport system permease protein